MTSGKPSITSAELLYQLKSQDPAVVSKTLKKLETVANINDLPSIVAVMANITEVKLLKEFTDFLSRIRSTKAPALMARFLADPANAQIRIDLVRACWESNLDYSPHLLLFARLFIAEDFLLALEAFSVIENTCLERPVSQTVLMEVSDLIKNSVPDQPETRQKLTIELLHVLEPFITKG